MRSLVTLALMAGICFFYWASSLSFFPVPWADDSAFFLPGLDWVNWPPRYLMRCQAPWVPTYYEANFNTMPFLPTLMGVSHRLGITGVHAIRAYGMALLFAWGALLLAWMLHRGVSTALASIVALGAVLSPTLRWGSMLVRPEEWQGVIWLLILMELSGFFQQKSKWRLPIFFAFAAYVHFEGVFWVLPTAVGLFPWTMEGSPHERFKEWVSRLGSVTWRTTVLLAPWLFYLFWNWDHFWTQMATQFGRLEIENPQTKNAYLLFHYLFIGMGEPSGLPKFFNLGKIIFWAALIIYPVAALYRAWRSKLERGLLFAAVLALVSMFYLWLTKPEVWFKVLIHFSVWPLLALLMPRAGAWRRAPQALVGGVLLLLLVLEAGASLSQWRASREDYTWNKYNHWIDCLDTVLGDRVKVWQPNPPDVLVDLAARSPWRDYTRHVDFPGVEHLVEAHAHNVDAIIHSVAGPPGAAESFPSYQGALRPLDRDFFFTHWGWNYSADTLGPPWEYVVCQEGPFWAAVSLKPASLN